MWVCRNIVIALIDLYRFTTSPLLIRSCRFYPSCSIYARIAIEHYGVVNGTYLAAKRIFCCHPFSPGGFDPVPTVEFTCFPKSLSSRRSMEIKRIFVWLIFMASVILLYDNWQHFSRHKSILLSKEKVQQELSKNSIPQTGISASNSSSKLNSNQISSLDSQTILHGENIRISTDVFEGSIDTLGATLNRLSLIKKNKNEKSDLRIKLFDQTSDCTYLARTGLSSQKFPDHTIFTLTSPRSFDQDGKNLEMNFISPVIDGLKLTKTYIFKPGSYVIEVNQHVENVSNHPIQPSIYMELVRDDKLVETPRFSHTFTGPAFYTAKDHFRKIPFTDIESKRAKYMQQVDNGWIAMVQHYFVSAWILDPGIIRNIYVDKISDSLYCIGYKLQLPIIQPGASSNIRSSLFVGPEEERTLEKIAPGLELVKDYGWVAIIAKPLFWLLEKIFSYLNNWGWSIVVLTFLIKAVFFPLSAASYKSMARMKELTPTLQILRERYKDEPKKLNQAMMELYKKHKVNPLGGCLPVVVQIPVFISLYWVLLSSVEMKGAPWIMWIQDLSQKDPYFILPILMTISMLVQAKLNPEPADPIQAKMALFMPLIFSFMFFFFPAGLVLYYVVNNFLSIFQQWWITRMMSGIPKKKKI